MNDSDDQMWQWTGKTPLDLSQFNQKAADALLGKVVLIGKTYQKSDGKTIKRTRNHGVITDVQRTNGVAIQLHNSSEVIWLPPDMRSWQRTRPGIYKLKSAREEIEDPDYITTWIVNA